ncbi:hypothetical protein F5B22DRAFT_652261 [Xylaria bambusicola]|uniref:uncharacterized protein n=1 Tax=Xylaria bambusicola TaxID=326684 RepID=UPI002008E8FA|nr:uncharacterized protein F5B22DRAFT_652261 [Xylaria bambusicola]KAI0503263.1 hypothetical protein F5B22DRAFT_652261 [Xylaria bambusicola]
MAADTLPATLGFLTDAAHLLASAAPETSAHLMSRRNALMFDNELGQSDVQRQRVCGCCGHIMIAGLGDVLKIDSNKSCHKKKRAGSKQRKGGVSPKVGCRKTWNCSKCGRYTAISLPPPTRIPQRRFKSTALRSSITTKSVGSAQVASASASSSAAATAATATLASKDGSTPAVALVASSELTRVSANASSKKRAKNRKQGLQALLQQSSSSKPQSGLGLSLADFMQH